MTSSQHSNDMGGLLGAKQHDLLQMHVRMALQMVEELYGEEEMRLALGHLRSAVRILGMACAEEADHQAPASVPDARIGSSVVEPVERELPPVSPHCSEPVFDPPSKGPAPLMAATHSPETHGDAEPVAAPTVPPAAMGQLEREAPPHAAQSALAKSERLADSFVHRGVRNEVYAQADNRVESRRLGATLASSLSINDRRYYANALCGGDRESFRQLVEQLDGMPTLAHSVAHLQQHYSGSVDNPALHEFIALLERRFS